MASRGNFSSLASKQSRWTCQWAKTVYSKRKVTKTSFYQFYSKMIINNELYIYLSSRHASNCKNVKTITESRYKNCRFSINKKS